MITGRQIREARALLGWHCSKLARSAKLPQATVEWAELSDGEPLVAVAIAQMMQRALEAT